MYGKSGCPAQPWDLSQGSRWMRLVLELSLVSIDENRGKIMSEKTEVQSSASKSRAPAFVNKVNNISMPEIKQETRFTSPSVTRPPHTDTHTRTGDYDMQ